MIPPTVAVSDIIQVCNFLRITISQCLSATEDKLELYQDLSQLNGIISLIATHMDQYILYTDQLQHWYSSLNTCKTLTSKLHKSLLADPAGLSALERVKFAMLGRSEIEKQMKKLNKHVETLMKLEEIITQEATKKEGLQGLRHQEKHVRAEAGLREYESIAEGDCISTRLEAPQSGKMNTQAQIGRVSKLREKFSA